MHQDEVAVREVLAAEAAWAAAYRTLDLTALESMMADECIFSVACLAQNGVYNSGEPWYDGRRHRKSPFHRLVASRRALPKQII